MKEKQKKEKKRNHKRNGLYAVAMVWKLSPSRILVKLLTEFIGVGTWVFYSTFFMKYIIGAITGGDSYLSILKYILIVGGVTFVLQLFSAYARNVGFPLGTFVFTKKLYRMLYEKAENVELACYENTEFYNQYTMAVDNADVLVVNVADKVCAIFAAIVGAAVTYSVMFTINPRLVLFILAPLLGSFVFGSIANKVTVRMYKESNPPTRQIEYVNRVMYLKDYAKELRLTNIYKIIRRTFERATEEKISIAKKYIGPNITYPFLQYYFSYTIIFEGVLLFGAYECLVSKRMDLSGMVVVASMMSTAAWILVGMAYNVLDCNRDCLFIDNLRTFLAYEEKLPENQKGEQIAGAVTELEFRDVSFAYPGREPVLSHISFQIKKGSSLALAGHNGAGKTTIVKLLMRLYDPTEGEILVNGKNIKEYELCAYRELFATAFQDYKIFSDTILENVRLGHEDVSRDDCIRALARAGVMEKVNTLEQGVDTLLTKEFDSKGAVLSGGELQKIAVARAFARKAQIKIFDEPSSALDPIAEAKLFDEIKEESKECVCVFISHRLSSVQGATEVLMLNEGQVIERGTHESLMKEDGPYAQMYRMQAENYLTGGRHYA